MDCPGAHGSIPCWKKRIKHHETSHALRSYPMGMTTSCREHTGAPTHQIHGSWHGAPHALVITHHAASIQSVLAVIHVSHSTTGQLNSIIFSQQVLSLYAIFLFLENSHPNSSVSSGASRSEDKIWMHVTRKSAESLSALCKNWMNEWLSNQPISLHSQTGSLPHLDFVLIEPFPTNCKGHPPVATPLTGDDCTGQCLWGNVWDIFDKVKGVFEQRRKFGHALLNLQQSTQLIRVVKPSYITQKWNMYEKPTCNLNNSMTRK